MLETINKNQVNVILNKNTDEIATLIEKHKLKVLSYWNLNSSAIFL